MSDDYTNRAKNTLMRLAISSDVVDDVQAFTVTEKRRTDAHIAVGTDRFAVNVGEDTTADTPVLALQAEAVYDNGGSLNYFSLKDGANTEVAKVGGIDGEVPGSRGGVVNQLKEPFDQHLTTYLQ